MLLRERWDTGITPSLKGMFKFAPMAAEHSWMVKILWIWLWACYRDYCSRAIYNISGNILFFSLLGGGFVLFLLLV